ncbi:MAG: DUF5053 domain-containing protein [Odoribacter splanchnicus]|nr:DUF5053 domain-containing protein [Odoribacter splanchnicus]
MNTTKVWFNEKYVFIETDKGETGKLPLEDFPRLKNATKKQRENFTVSAFGIHWPDMDEDLSIEGFFNYQASPQTEIRRKLGKITDMVSMSYIASHYFGKTRTWLYQRINGNLINGKPAQFTKEEIERLNEALKEIGRELGSVSLT